MINILISFTVGTVAGVLMALLGHQRAERRDDDSLEAVARALFGTEDGGPR